VDLAARGRGRPTARPVHRRLASGRLRRPGDNTPVTPFSEDTQAPMRTFRQMLAAMIIAILSAPKYVLEGGKWVLRSLFAPPMPQGGEIEQAMDAVRAAAAPTEAPLTPASDTVQTADAVRKASLAEAADAVREWGRLARAYATHRLSSDPEPDLRALDESAEAWLRGLSDAECQRLLESGAQRVSDHMLGAHLIPGLSRCQQYPSWAPAIVLADVPGDERYDAVRADLARDPSLVPGYRVAA